MNGFVRALAWTVAWGTLLMSAVALDGCGPAPNRPEIRNRTTPEGTWYLNANGFRLELSIRSSGKGFTGEIVDESGMSSSIAFVSWDPTNRWLEFRRDLADFFQWYRLRLVQGVVAGRYSRSLDPNKPPLDSYIFHATGWSPTRLPITFRDRR